MIWLGIESSCDETACAVLQDDPLKVLSNPLYSQIDEHALYGGVVPEIAARAHLQKISPIAEAAVKEAGIELKDIDAIAYTTGPGLMGPLLVGASFAKGLARDLQIPAYGMNHLEGHLAAAWLTHPEIEPPFLTLTVSGGHTELVLEEPGFKYTSIGRTRDDAAGEAFDKCGKLLGLKYPAGATISRLGKDGNRKFVDFPRALHVHDNCEFSFSGLKTAVLRYTETHDPEFIQKSPFASSACPKSGTAHARSSARRISSSSFLRVPGRTTKSNCVRASEKHVSSSQPSVLFCRRNSGEIYKIMRSYGAPGAASGRWMQPRLTSTMSPGCRGYVLPSMP